MNMTHSIIFRRVIVAVAPAIIVGCTIAPLPDIDTKVTENPDYKIIRALGMSTESIVETEDTYGKSSMQDYIGKTRQVYYTLISPSKVNNIKVYIDS